MKSEQERKEQNRINAKKSRDRKNKRLKELETENFHLKFQLKYLMEQRRNK